MDKVIIGGVDVSECKDYHYKGCSANNFCKCDSYKNCYYKQLQRAKAENEELKKQAKNNETAHHTELGTYNMECGNLLEENKTLIAENERLKKDLEIALREENRWKSNCNNYREICQKRYQTLQEIRELTKL